MKRILVLTLILVFLIFAGGILSSERRFEFFQKKITYRQPVATPTAVPDMPTIEPTSTPTPIPTPTIDTVKYGPCRNIPILMYHHVNLLEGEQKTSASLTVRTDVFNQQMDYLSQKGYQTITLNELVDGLNDRVVLPGKPVVITFDDGYLDFYTDAFPVLRSHNFKATVFVSSGLVESGPGYLTWSQIREMDGSGLVTIGNHTWSHKYLSGKDRGVVESEITTSQTQFESFLGKKPNFFAYPYGADSAIVESVLLEQGFKGAVVTYPHPQCAKLPLELGRKRIGGVNLSNYGL